MTLSNVLLDEVGVLIVDDVKTMQIQIKELMKSTGFMKIETAGGGEEAKKILQAQGPGRIQLVLSDWHMAPTTGLSLLEWVRKEPLFHETAFIMITAENTKEQVLQAIGAGVDDYLMKPITADQITSKVFGTLTKRKVL